MVKISAHLFMRVVGSVSVFWAALALQGSYVQMRWNVGLNSSAYSSVLSYNISCENELQVLRVFVLPTRKSTYTEPRALLVDTSKRQCQILSFSSHDPRPQQEDSNQDGSGTLTLYETLCPETSDNIGHGRCQRSGGKQTFADCQEYFENGYSTSGIFTLQLNESVGIDAWCDFDANNGWTVILRRENTSINFDRNWTDYKHGFGDLNSEYWLGNEHIHLLTEMNGNRRLQINMQTSEDEEINTEYSSFYIKDEVDLYKLYSAHLVSSTGLNCNNDALAPHIGMSFTTRDRDNDNDNTADKGYNCADYYEGGWWFKHCYQVYLTGNTDGQGIAVRCNNTWLKLQGATMRVTKA